MRSISIDKILMALIAILFAGGCSTLTGTGPTMEEIKSVRVLDHPDDHDVRILGVVNAYPTVHGDPHEWALQVINALREEALIKYPNANAIYLIHAQPRSLATSIEASATVGLVSRIED